MPPDPPEQRLDRLEARLAGLDETEGKVVQLEQLVARLQSTVGDRTSAPPPPPPLMGPRVRRPGRA